MAAVAVIRRRVVLAADAFVEIVVGQVPTPVTPSKHPFTYRLSYVVANGCVIRYDNERGKGDHRQLGDREQVYRFSTPDQLLADFAEDVERWNHENGRA